MQPNDKIQPLEQLAKILTTIREQTNKKIVHCHGVFDLLHVGHIRHFEQAGKFGDILVVTLTPDKYVNKGPLRPAFPQTLRAEAIAALGCVSYVSVNEWPTAVETIKLLKPDVYVKGSEYRKVENDLTGKIVDEEQAVLSVGGKLLFTDDITFSSSALINRHLPLYPKEVAQYLDSFKSKFSVEDVLHYLQGARNLKVLVIGEAIIDEYHYCETMGKSGKEPIMAARFLSKEKSAGGVLAAANHLAAFSDHVTLLTFLGEQDSQEDFIVKQLNSNVEKIFLPQQGVPTIVKRRFVETYPFQKLFEIYVMGENEETAAHSELLCRKLKEILPSYDLVVVTDYGHGMLGTDAVKLLSRKAPFLAVNTQSNADNHGFNTVSKYMSADFISVSEKEIRLEVRSRRRELDDIISEVSSKLGCERILITRGKSGCLAFGKQEGLFHIPAFTIHVVDRIGAGDAVFSVTSLAVAQKAPMELVGFIANCVGAEAVGIVGNRSYLQREPLLKHVESMLK
jgi:rfaE bifunctional protein kinase chain/domain/rfaE bifunctional protein nucleotidyltransferase chain/domain